MVALEIHGARFAVTGVAIATPVSFRSAGDRRAGPVRAARHQGTRRPGPTTALRPGGRSVGFTLIELLVVMAIIAMLVTLALPRYLHSMERSKEAVLLEDLSVMRDAIDKYGADRGQYPTTLDDLVQRNYLRRIPVDPITESDSTWVTNPHPDGVTPGIYNVHSGAAGKTLAGNDFKEL